ncbi:PrgI family protein [Adlercreutzia sp. ZJ473]|uniref:PrgI family protein n=1 Tax=Adlercreutzia sp. ZJ473 TaxID=2722822 RepID=UPI0015577298|nr:PrgI family protein [Adlercreutzia sp. ZJ473]
MPGYVDVPKDLNSIKSKVAFGLTRRQLICFGIAAAVGLPFFFIARPCLGNTLAVALMALLMVPGFAFGLYEKNGLPLEAALTNFIDVRYRKPAIRKKRFKS